MAPSATSGSSNLPARIASALILAPIAVAVTIAGGWYFVGLIALAAWLMTYEWDRLTRGSGITINASFQVVALGAAVIASQFGMVDVAVIAIAAGIVVALTVSLVQKRSPFWAMLGVVYVGLPSVLLVLLRGDVTMGFGIVMWIFVVVWGTDMAAYFVGKGLGGPKLTRISPHKTWAGLLGGVSAAAILGAIVADAFALGPGGFFAIAAAVCALIAQAGDLFESWIKRRFDQKDSSRLIPGHGGVLDRLDGLLPVVVAVAFAAWLHPDGNLSWR